MDVAETCILETGGFGWVDYLVLAIVLIGSCAIGIFFAMAGPKQTTSEDFLLGGSSMGTVPTALSLAAGFVTAIELLGNPSEMYYHGSQFWMICFSFLLVVPITSYLYLPVFRELQLTSSYEYLEMRFNKYARLIAASMYVIQMVLYTSVAVYAPALALSHVTGTNVYLAVTIVYIVCIIYASQGGMKSVIMTDTFQAFVLIVSIIVVMAIGNEMLKNNNNNVNIYETNEHYGRIEFFNMNPSLTVRHTFWSVVIGGTFYWATMFCANQASIQKYMSVRTISQARRALWTAAVGLILIFSINFYTGAIIFGQYSQCDPLMNKEISAADEILPSYVMKMQGKLFGIPGLFVSGIFAASLGNAQLHIKVDKLCRDIPVRRGLRQGDVPSAKIFNAVLQEVFYKCDWESKGINVNGQWLNNLRFADDVVIIGKNEREVKEMVEELIRNSNEVGLKVNNKKTKIMYINCDAKEKIFIEGEEIESVESFTYLGQKISKSGQQEEIKRRIILSWHTFNKYKPVFRSCIDMAHKSRLWRMCVMPVLVYGSETWKIDKNAINRIRITVRSMQRTMLRISRKDRKSKEWIRAQSFKEDVVKTIAERKWNWAGHIMRTTDGRWTKRVIEWVPLQFKRKRGRPAYNWDEEFRKVCGGAVWHRVAADRREWQRMKEVYKDVWLAKD